MATVHQDGPFSLFPNIDRRLVLLSGQLTLRIGDMPAMTIQQVDPPIAFRGDVPVDAQLCAGAAVDLNLMTRRDRHEVSFNRLEFDSPIGVDGGQTMFVLTETDGLGLSFDRVEGSPVCLGRNFIRGDASGASPLRT